MGLKWCFPIIPSSFLEFLLHLSLSRGEFAHELKSVKLISLLVSAMKDADFSRKNSLAMPLALMQNAQHGIVLHCGKESMSIFCRNAIWPHTISQRSLWVSLSSPLSTIYQDDVTVLLRSIKAPLQLRILLFTYFSTLFHTPECERCQSKSSSGKHSLQQS